MMPGSKGLLTLASLHFINRYNSLVHSCGLFVNLIFYILMFFNAYHTF